MTAALKSAASPGPGAPVGAAAETARERSGVYGFLAEVFRAEPTPALLRKIRDGHFVEVLTAAGAHLGEDFAAQPEAELLEDLAVEYTRLFLGPGKHVRPYAATYLGGAGASLCGPTTVWARDFMERSGFALTPEHRDLPDHVSIELEFMARMAEREARAIEESDDETAGQCRWIQKEFLDNHLGRWLPEFCGHAAEHAELSFYRELARLTGHFVESEAEYFAQAAETA
jgi:TorA maturation chaperone TorD